MARNDERRAALADAGIIVLAEEGARGLTHRAVDAAADVPRGTASNYFPTRALLVEALVNRIGQRLTPDPALLAERAEQTPDMAAFAAYTRDIVHRLSAQPVIPIALFELRLEATRRPEIAEALHTWRQQSFDADVAFSSSANLPGGRTEIALLHYAIDGLMLDHLAVPLNTGLSADDAVDSLVTRILGSAEKSN